MLSRCIDLLGSFPAPRIALAMETRRCGATSGVGPAAPCVMPAVLSSIPCARRQQMRSAVRFRFYQMETTSPGNVEKSDGTCTFNFSAIFNYLFQK